MRKIILAAITLSFMMMSFMCRLGNSYSFDRNHRNATYIKMSNGIVNEEIKYYGKIKLSEDETGIASISPNGYLIYKNDDEKLSVESNYHGEITYEVNDSGKKTVLDENAKRLLAEVVKEMIAIGFDAEARVERIYKQGGNRAVLNEIENLKADNIKAIYFERILKSDSLSQGDLIEIAKKISSQLGSDNDKERILSRFTFAQLQYPLAVNAYLDAVENMGSDNAKENLLRQFISKDTIQQDHFLQLFGAINRLGSDNAKENLIMQILRERIIPEERFDQLLDAINHLGSDNAKENLIMEIINGKNIPENHFDQLLIAINRLGSDNAKENLFSNLIGKETIEAGRFNKIINGISQLGSDNAKTNLFRKLVDENNKTEDQWIALIDIAGNVNGDNEKANLLIELANKMPTSEKIKTTYMKIAKTINSDSDFGRAVKAVQ